MISHFLSIKGHGPLSGPDPVALLARLPLWVDAGSRSQTIFRAVYVEHGGKPSLVLGYDMIKLPILIYPDTDLIIRLETAK